MQYMKPLIGIVAKTYADSDWSSPFYGQRTGYIRAIAASGGLPVVVPLTDDEQLLRELYKRLDGIVLAGGGDIEPARYDARLEQFDPALADIMKIDPLRDECELTITKWAESDGKPVLGICRGLQILNVAHGGTMHQDIAGLTIPHQNHIASLEAKNWQKLAHEVRYNPETRIGKALGPKPHAVNSLHHQAVHKLGAGLAVAGTTSDGLIEAIEGMNVWGFQFHPEELFATDERCRRIFEFFIRQVAHFQENPEALRRPLALESL
jgi:putative glutamine amidotransferase